MFETHIEGEEHPHIVFEESAIERILDLFDWSITELGLICEEYDDHEAVKTYVLDTGGRPIHVEDLAGIVQDEDGDPVPLRDHIADIGRFIESQRDDDE